MEDTVTLGCRFEGMSFIAERPATPSRGFKSFRLEDQMQLKLSEEISHIYFKTIKPNKQTNTTKWRKTLNQPHLWFVAVYLTSISLCYMHPCLWCVPAWWWWKCVTPTDHCSWRRQIGLQHQKQLHPQRQKPTHSCIIYRAEGLPFLCPPNSSRKWHLGSIFFHKSNRKFPCESSA